MEYWCHLIALGIGMILDLILGDPYSFYHPVRTMGKLIGWLETKVRRYGGKSEKKEYAGGVILVLLTVGISTGAAILLLSLAYTVNKTAGIGLEAVLCYQMMAAKCLQVESMKVYDALCGRDLEKSRYFVSMIVGRDTERLDEQGVIRASIETVSENTSDGVIAPLIFMAVFGAAGGVFYKAVNTIDSMIGYKDEKYKNMGRFGAKLDDICNFLPARISALAMIVASFFMRLDGKNAWKIWRRDRGKHDSPNSAQTEAVCAGALQVRLAGDAWYFGKLYKKEYIGDDIRPVQPEDIRKTIWLMYGTLAICSAIIFLFHIMVYTLTCMV